MPELPEVETIAQRLRRGDQCPSLLGQKITSVSIQWPRHIAKPSITAFLHRVSDQVIREVERRGKYLVFPLDHDTLLIHLRMSGDLLMAKAQIPFHPHDRTIFHFDGGWDLRFRDVRKLGKVYLLRDPQEVLGKLGPEPLSPEFTLEAFSQRLSNHRRMIKALLLDQTFVAGLGNIYTDEALHHAGLHPLRRSDTLQADEIQALWQSIRKTLLQGIQQDGASIDWAYRGGNFQNLFYVYGRTGEPCRTCGTPIKRTVVGQRGTHYCPVCQLECAS